MSCVYISLLSHWLNKTVKRHSKNEGWDFVKAIKIKKCSVLGQYNVKQSFSKKFNPYGHFLCIYGSYDGKINPCTSRATFLSPMVHSNMLFLPIATIGYSLTNSRSMYTNFINGVGLYKGYFAEYHKTDCFIVFMFLYNDTQLLIKLCSFLFCFYIWLIDLLEHSLSFCKFSKNNLATLQV